MGYVDFGRMISFLCGLTKKDQKKMKDKTINKEMGGSPSTNLAIDFLTSQPNDHLNIIFGFFCGLDVIRMRSTSRRLASFATRHWPIISQRHNEALAKAIRALDDNFPTIIREQQYENVLSTYFVPGVTKAYIGCESLSRRKKNKYPWNFRGEWVRDEHIEFMVRRCGGELVELCIGTAIPGLFRLTNRSLAALEKCPKLEMLDIGSHSNLSKAQMVSLVSKVSLTHLYLPNCDQLTQGAEIFRSLPRLTQLDLSSCRSLTHSTLMEISTLLTGLTHLALAQCKGLTDESFVTICSRNPHLVSINVMQCSQLTDLSVVVMAESCRDLEEVVLDYCHVTDRAIESLSRCRRISRLSLLWCYKITDLSIPFIIDAFLIEELHMTKCSITPDNANVLSQRFPNAVLSLFEFPNLLF
jgi:hypothetical protein